MFRNRLLSILALGIAALTLTAGVSFAGRVPNPGAAVDIVSAHGSVVYSPASFAGGELAVVEVAGDGSGDRDLYGTTV